MLRFPIDYFTLIVVGFVIGFISMMTVRPMALDPDLPTFGDLQAKIAAGEIDPTPKPISQGSIDATYAWLGDTPRFYKKLERLMANDCSDDVMRDYGQTLSTLDMGGFDAETGRLIGVEGQPVTNWGMKEVLNTALPLQPLAYLKDEFVPANFKAVMKNVRRKSDWTTCEFNMPRAILSHPDLR